MLQNSGTISSLDCARPEWFVKPSLILTNVTLGVSGISNCHLIKSVLCRAIQMRPCLRPTKNWLESAPSLASSRLVKPIDYLFFWLCTYLLPTFVCQIRRNFFRIVGNVSPTWPPSFHQDSHAVRTRQFVTVKYSLSMQGHLSPSFFFCCLAKVRIHFKDEM